MTIREYICLVVLNFLLREVRRLVKGRRNGFDDLMNERNFFYF